MMSHMRNVAALFVAACLVSIADSHTRRFSVKYHSSAAKTDVLRQLESAGYTVVAHFDRQQVIAVVHSAHDDADATHAERLAGLAGVQLAERDHVRYPMQLGRTGRDQSPGRYSHVTDSCTYSDEHCKWRNLLVNQTGSPGDFVPYGIRMTQAKHPSLDKYRSTRGTGVLLCVIDDGIYSQHPDFRKDSLTGCTSDNDPETGFQCPFPWNVDDSGHCTHVSGTLSAAGGDGVGVVGMIPGGADIFYVKVFNGSCDPNFGCGPVYGTSLVDAFQTCEDHLNAKQAQDVSKRWTMVVSMSLGGPGPVTLEKMYFSIAAQRNDILWVAASGNSGPGPGEPVPGLEYPAAYAEVVSVAAVDCNEEHLDWSTSNSAVELSAPGSDVYSDAIPGNLRISISKFVVTPAPSVDLSTAQALSGIALLPGQKSVRSATGRLMDCGLAEAECAGAAGGAVCLIERSDSVLWVQQLANCQAGGGAGALIFNNVSGDTLGCVLPPWDAMATFPVDQDDPYEYTNASLVPAVKMSYDQGLALLALLAEGDPVNVTLAIKTAEAVIIKFDGTSMATPHVSGAAARVWSAHPACTASDVRAALRKGAKHLGSGTTRNDDYGYGLVQVKDALTALSKAQCSRKAKGRRL